MLSAISYIRCASVTFKLFVNCALGSSERTRENTMTCSHSSDQSPVIFFPAACLSYCVRKKNKKQNQTVLIYFCYCSVVLSASDQALLKLRVPVSSFLVVFLGL